MTPSHVADHVWNLGERGGTESRSPLDWLSRAGIGLLSFFADLTGGGSGGPSGRSSAKSTTKRQDQPAYQPSPEAEPIPACCHLALPDTECRYRIVKSNYTCPPGYYRQWWFCCEGTRQVGCGECTKSTTTCWSGPFICSIWWWSGQSC
jgi:hypothetical protein